MIWKRRKRRGDRGYDLPEGFLVGGQKLDPLPPPSRGADHSTEPRYDPREIERFIVVHEDSAVKEP